MPPKDAKEYQRQWRAANPEKVKENSRRYRNGVRREALLERKRKYYAANKERHKNQVRDASIKRRFTLTPEEYDAILLEQGGVCAGCGRASTEFKKHLAVDHDHTTRKVRGLLCMSCNQMIPTRRNVRALFAALLAYLDDPPAERVVGTRLAAPMKRKKRAKK